MQQISEHRRKLLAVVVVLFAVAGWYASLYASLLSAPPAVRNARYMSEEVLGIQTTGVAGAFKFRDDNGIDIGSSDPKSQAAISWTLPRYEASHDLLRARDCHATAYLITGALGGLASNAFVRVAVNGKTVNTIRFSPKSNASVPSFGSYSPASSARLEPIFESPLYRPFGFQFPLADTTCSAGVWQLSIKTRGVEFTLERLGIHFHFIPVPDPSLSAKLTSIVIAALELSALAIGAFLLLRSVSAIAGTAGLFVAMAIFFFAAVTHDQWDFPAWLRFIDLRAFGSANPAYLWAGTPFWPVLLTALSAVSASSSYLFNNASYEVGALALKLLIAESVVTVAVVAAVLAAQPVRRMLFFAVILSPLALYLAAGGYRETIAGAFLVLSVAASTRRSYFAATIGLTAAASIEEGFAPMLALVPALILSTETGAAAILRSLAFFGLSVALVAAQWILLIPRGLASTFISQRVVSYRFGGASWYGVLSDLQLLPKQIADTRTLVFVVLFCLLATPAIVTFIRFILRKGTSRVNAFDRALELTAALVAAFSLSFPGTDPNTWFALNSVLAILSARKPHFLLPFILLSSVEGLMLYAIGGLTDFVNWTYLWPRDQGLFGILDKPVDVFALTANLLIIAIYLKLLIPKLRMVSSATVPIMISLAAASLAGTKAWYLPDALFIAGILLALFSMVWKLREADAGAVAGARPISLVTGVVIVGVSAYLSPASWNIALIAEIAVVAGLRLGFAILDLPIAIGAVVMSASQTGTWPASIVGIAGLVGTSLYVTYDALSRVPLPATEAD